MIKWKTKFFILILFYYSKFINCQNGLGNQNDVNITYKDYYDYSLELGKIQIKYLNYKKENQFTFKLINETKQNDLLVNFHSIDCGINIIKKNNHSKANVHITGNKTNIFSIFIKSNEINNMQLLVEPFLYSRNNNKNIKYRVCPVVINSYYINNPKIEIKEEESMVLSFIENLSTIELSYKIKNLNKDSFIILSFIFDENLIFSVDIKNELNRVTSNSSNIFIYYNELSKTENGILTFKIIYNKENASEPKNNPLLIFKLSESNSISILEKNKLNLGFTTSKKVNQYYYLEVFKGEEGEVMLHNKRLYGELYGYIKSKSRINPYNREEYLKKGEDNQLQFYANTRKLSFKLNQTEQCEEGCYLFITYSHDNYDFNSRVGFEYTLLARIWDEEEIGSQIINIPFNEYIFGVFEEKSINHHYYSFFIPRNTKSIIVQFEGNSIEGFSGFGNKKLNTFRELNNIQKINDGEIKIIKEINVSDSNVNDYISFAFRLKKFFEKEFSFYYFRILLLKKDEKNIIYPLDSDIGNICTPEKEENDYFCYCLLKNYYNEFSLNYSFSASNNKDKLSYSYYEMINGYIKGYNLANITSASIEKYNNYTSLVKFKVENTKIINILSTLSNKKQKIYPQIYSTQMYYFRENKEMTFNLNKSFTFILNHILGQGTIQTQNYNLNLNVNSKGKPFLIPINKRGITLKFNFNEAEESKELIFYTKFQQNYNIKELTQGETLREFVYANRFPIYYFIKNGENKINHMNIHFIIQNFKDTINKTTSFEITGYIMNKTDFDNKRNINGEFIDLKNPIRGSYDVCFKNGILNINRTINGSYYVLVKIDYSSDLDEDDLIIMEILTMFNNSGNYTLPINNYITDIYDSTEEKRYKIIVDEEDFINNDEILVEFIPDCNRITLDRDNKSIAMNINDSDGIVQKYRITGFSDDFTLKVMVPQDISYGNYIIRYYFTKKEKEIHYKLNKIFTQIKGNQKNDIILKFDKIQITNYNNKTIKEKIYFKIYGFLYIDENDIKNEFINSSETPQEKIFKANTTIQKDNNFSLYFSRVKSYNKKNLFNLQMKIISLDEENIFNEEFFVYTLPVIIEGVSKEEFPLKWVIIISSLVLVIIIIIIIFTIGYIKMKKSNTNLKEKVLAISFTSEKIDEEINERRTSIKDEDYENTFI